MGAAEIIAIISALITGFTGAVAVMAIKSSKKENDYNLSHKTYEEISEWYDETLEVMKDLHTPYTLGLPIDVNQKINLLSKLSKHISKGHAYFPNKQDGTNMHKPTTFQGKSCIIRDLLILYYNIYATNIEKDNMDVLNALQRSFENEMNIYLNKNRYTEKIIPYTKYDVTSEITRDRKNLLTIEHLEDPFVKSIICKKDLVEVFSNIKLYHSTVRELMYQEQVELQEMEKQVEQTKRVEKSSNQLSQSTTLDSQAIVALNKDIKNKKDIHMPCDTLDKQTNKLDNDTMDYEEPHNE